MRKQIIFIAIILYFTSCKQNFTPNTNNNSYLTIKINGQKPTEKVLLSKIVDSFEITPLQTDSTCFIGRVDKVVMFNDHFFVLDRFSTKRLLEFDKNGNFIRQYGKPGEGPGEYFMTIMDFTILNDSNQIVTTDGAQYLYYDFQGNYIKKTVPDFLTSKFEYCGQNTFVCIGGGKDDNLIISDIYGKRINSFFPYLERPINVLLFIPLVKRTDKILYSKYINDTVYSVSCSTLKPKPYVVIDFGGKSLTLEKYFKLKKSEKNNISDFLNKAGYFTKYNFLETSNTILIYFSKNSKSYLNLYSKNDKKSIVFGRKDFINDITFENNSIFYPVGINKDRIIFLVEPYILIENFNKINNSLKGTENYKKIEKLVSKLSETSNPVLFTVKFKK